MKLKMFMTGVFAWCMLFTASAAFGAEKGAESQNVPEVRKISETQNEPIVFPLSDKFDFSSVIEGEKVTHEFVIQNKGTADLMIKRVKTG